MKRNVPNFRSGKRFGLALMNFTKEQLAGIGGVAVAYYAVEELVDDMVRIGWRLDFDPKEILARIGGIDGKFHLIKHAAKVWEMPEDLREALGAIFSDAEFGLYRKWRDGVIHARPRDAKNSHDRRPWRWRSPDHRRS